MDPNDVLKNLRKALAATTCAGDESDAYDALVAAAEAFEALDEWLRKGGTLPSDWYRESRASRWNLED